MSITEIATRSPGKGASRTACQGSSNQRATPTNRPPVASSVRGYTNEIGALQAWHRPRSASHEITGMLSTPRSGGANAGQRDRGRRIASPAGTRWIATVRNDPKTSPKGSATTIRKTTSTDVIGPGRYRTEPARRPGRLLDLADVRDVLVEPHDGGPRDQDGLVAHVEQVADRDRRPDDLALEGRVVVVHRRRARRVDEGPHRAVESGQVPE